MTMVSTKRVVFNALDSGFILLVLYRGIPLSIALQGTSGMKYSLISRDWIADCAEITHSGYTAVMYFLKCFSLDDMLVPRSITLLISQQHV